MMHFDQVTEPEAFPDLVRTPGEEFLATVPSPKGTQWNGNDFWNRVKIDVRVAFHQLCAYSAFLIHDDGQIDHYRPKDEHPELAYEWQNYRYCSGAINQSKGTRMPNRILDPFEVQDEWFEIQIPGYELVLTSQVPANQRVRAQDTIDFLDLNREPFKQVRQRYAQDLLADFNLGFLEHVRKFAPLVARAVEKYKATH